MSYTDRFPVHTCEVDAFNTPAVPALAGYLQEVAGADAARMGCGLDALMRRGLTWVLVRQRIEIAEPTLETIPQPIWRSCRLATLEAHYLAECGYGSTIAARVAAANDREFVHTILRAADRKELARLRSTWIPRAR